MLELTREMIRTKIADSEVIFKRGLRIFENGAFRLGDADMEKGLFRYDIDGNYGDYIAEIQLDADKVSTSCDCPYPGTGCKHTVAVLLDLKNVLAQSRRPSELVAATQKADALDALTPEEIRLRALEERENRARNEVLNVYLGEMFKGDHLVETKSGRQYTVTMHDPVNAKGHCSCPDYLTNRLGTCKHLIFLTEHLKQKRGFQKRVSLEQFPFADIYWDSLEACPRIYCDLPKAKLGGAEKIIREYFDSDGRFSAPSLADFMPLLSRLNGHKQIRIRETVLERVEASLQEAQLAELSKSELVLPDYMKDMNIRLYPYQEEGVRFGLYKKAVLIGDEMGLGKTIQAIVLANLKKEVFGFNKTLIITLASLKDQWAREIKKFTGQTALIIGGAARQRQAQYLEDKSFFKITNYEAALRDITFCSRFKPDLIILDEAQRIKNFSTKTADAVKSIPRTHAIVLTGTPLENKLEDVYSIVQFLDPQMLSPLWKFASEHFILSRKKKDKVLGYCNLNKLHDKLKSIVIRRKKEEVLDDLPEQVVNNYYIDLHETQRKIHAGYAQQLMPLLNKKFLTPMDLRRIQELLLRMRMVCNSTYLVDRKTHVSPKLDEFEGILDEIVIQNNRKMVVFSEWVTMTYLIGRQLSEAQVPFVELSGKIPVKKRQALVDEFMNNPKCKVFLSTDAGGTGLNLQAADSVVNFELPWSPARLNQRVGRVNRIGQNSKCINVVNLIAKNSIEEKIFAGLQLKTELFEGVFEGNTDTVVFSQEKRTEMLNRLREMIGEQLEPGRTELSVSEDLPEDTPHYLNPKVLSEEASSLDITAEENMDSDGDACSAVHVAAEEIAPSIVEQSCQAGSPAVPSSQPPDAESLFGTEAPERMEAVLNTGMQFIGGLLEMATGKKMSLAESGDRMVRIDKNTGEVTLKFKLPGF